VPIKWSRADGLVSPSPDDIGQVTKQINAQRANESDGHDMGARYDMVVWAEVAPDPGALPGIARPYAKAGATWWIETARPEPAWWEGIQARVEAGPQGAGRRS
jgi:hypothetical protein